MLPIQVASLSTSSARSVLFHLSAKRSRFWRSASLQKPKLV
jgi:hypothetical protein